MSAIYDDRLMLGIVVESAANRNRVKKQLKNKKE